jgi:hypothetical protein
MNDADRIQNLRTRCLDRKPFTIPWDGDARLIARSMKASAEVSSWTVRRGMLTRDLLAWTPLAMDEAELLAGRLAQDCPEWAQERQQGRAYLQQHVPQVFTPGQTGHCQLDFSRLFDLGIDGLRAEVQQLERAASGQKAEVYHAFADALEGLSLFVENAARTADLAACGGRGFRLPPGGASAARYFL